VSPPNPIPRALFAQVSIESLPSQPENLWDSVSTQLRPTLRCPFGLQGLSPRYVNCFFPHSLAIRPKDPAVSHIMASSSPAILSCCTIPRSESRTLSQIFCCSGVRALSDDQRLHWDTFTWGIPYSLGFGSKMHGNLLSRQRWHGPCRLVQRVRYASQTDWHACFPPTAAEVPQAIVRKASASMRAG
jgi:hypothetical protein